ncbi:uncharacterized protein LOC120108651 [Phoenix dactylifera]|uniref:Uncharacterized protein LOC120108651 n=1 Tax=Phoenix dactylifera TaxID=42345 RepID=A0A8B8ZY11_PHODC|nr:uncharacterized protein LOC120108651 [Phoenix dactylifera]
MKDRATEVAASKTVANLRSCSAQIVPAYIPTLSTIATKSPISRPTQKILGEMELEFGERDRGQSQLGEFIVVSEEFGFFRCQGVTEDRANGMAASNYRGRCLPH